MLIQKSAVVLGGRLLATAKLATKSSSRSVVTRSAAFFPPRTEGLISRNNSPQFTTLTARLLSSDADGGTLYYAKSHEYVRVEGTTGTLGISQHAIDALGDLVFIELPEVGRAVEAGEELAVVESVKAASDIYSPLGGTVTAVNTPVVDEPTMVSKDCMKDGWLVKLELGDAGELGGLMQQAEYDEFLKGLDED